MNEKKITSDDQDMLIDVVSKLSAVSDFLKMIGCDPSLRKRTPGGLCLVIGECIDAIQQIGGIHEKPEH